MKLHKLNRVHKICFLQHFANGPVWYMDGRGPLATKLSRFVPLSNEDVRILDALCRNEECFEAHTDIVCQGDVPGSAFVLTRGMAFRSSTLGARSQSSRSGSRSGVSVGPPPLGG